jgi:microcystin-dependent protein
MAETESATRIDLLDDAKPGSGEDANLSDDYHRQIKTAVQGSFPNLAGAVTLTDTQLNNAVNLVGGNVIYMLFYEAAAPVGWTQNTALASLDGATIRMETGAGGQAVAGTHSINSPPSIDHSHTDTFAVANHTLTAAQIPQHRHTYNYVRGDESDGAVEMRPSDGYQKGHFVASNTGYVGSNGAHNHTLTGVVSSKALTEFAPKYINCILCSKD